MGTYKMWRIRKQVHFHSLERILQSKAASKISFPTEESVFFFGLIYTKPIKINTMTHVAVIFISVIICTFHLTNAQLGSADVSPLLRNPAVVQKQINCVLDKGPCDSTGRQLKVAIPEVINRNCAMCTPAQAKNARKVVAFVRQKYPSAWTAIQAKYRG